MKETNTGGGARSKMRSAEPGAYALGRGAHGPAESKAAGGRAATPSEAPPAAAVAAVAAPRVGMVSLGCPKNLVDGEVMLGRLQGAGYGLVADPKEADVIVVNTCAFIETAKQESVDAILEMAREKETGRAKRLVVTGCLTQRYDAELRREIPEIDATLGTGQVEGIVEAVGGAADVAGARPGRGCRRGSTTTSSRASSRPRRGSRT